MGLLIGFIAGLLQGMVGFGAGIILMIYLPTLYLVDIFTHLDGLWIPMTAFMVALLLAPKFQAIKTHNGEKIYMKWLFIKGVKEIE